MCDFHKHLGMIRKLPQKSRQTSLICAGNKGARVSKVPALSSHPCKARIGTPLSGPQTLAAKTKRNYQRFKLNI